MMSYKNPYPLSKAFIMYSTKSVKNTFLGRRSLRKEITKEQHDSQLLTVDNHDLYSSLFGLAGLANSPRGAIMNSLSLFIYLYHYANVQGQTFIVCKVIPLYVRCIQWVGEPSSKSY